MSDIFDQNNEAEVEITVDALVGEGKKYKSIDELAKGNVYGQNHIRTLETELATLREEAKNRQTTETLINQIRSLKSPDLEHDEQPERQPIVQEPGMTKADVERLFLEREVSAKQTQNLNLVVSTLKDRFGERVTTEVNAKAAELGISGDDLRNMARDKPQVVLSLFVGTQQPRDVFNAPAANQRPGAFSNKLTGQNWSDFEKIRKENKAVYESPAFQKKLFDAAEKAMNDGWYDQWKNS